VRRSLLLASLLLAAPAAFTLLAGLAAPSAFAAPASEPSTGRTSSLSWVRMPGADGCIATQALARGVEERLGRPGKVFVSAAQADVSVEGRIEKKRGASGWHATISVRDAKGTLLGTRELDRPEGSCDAMNEPLVLVIAVMIDPQAALKKTPDAEPAPAATPAPTPAPPAPAPEAPPPPPPPADTWHFEGYAAGTTALGLAPSPALGASIEALLYAPRLPLGFRGFSSLYLPTSADRDGARASFDLFYLGAELCPTLRKKHVNLMVCLGGHLGVLRSHPETASAKEATEPLWNAVTELRISVPLIAPVGVTAGVGGVAPLLHPTFVYTRPDGTQATLFEVPDLGFTADLGLGFVFP
jgi:hypothetical protein